DKMGFPVPLEEWFDNELSDFVQEIFQSMVDRKRPYLNQRALLNNLHSGNRFSRKTWGLLSLELWHQLYHDRAVEWRSVLKTS
ncbi:MAG: asparagine synthetase B, partial [Deltaproteobacteria bacterium HGW-Deltaproteobacteria-1]